MTEPLDLIEHRRLPISGSEVYVYAAVPDCKISWRCVPSAVSESEAPLWDPPITLFAGFNGSKSRGFILAYGGRGKDGDVVVHFSGRSGRDQISIAAEILAGGIWVAELPPRLTPSRK